MLALILQSKYWYQDAIALSTVTIAALTLVNLVVSFFLWRATAGATEVTRRIFEASHRPYVGVERIDTSLDMVARVFYVKAALQNFGSVPANDLTATWSILINGVPVQTDVLSHEPSILLPNLAIILRLDLRAAATYNAIVGNAQVDLEISTRYKGVTEKEYTYRQHTVHQPDHTFGLVSAKGD